MIDIATGKSFRPAEAEMAAIVENSTGYTMTAVDATKAGDFVITSGPYAGKTLDFLGMPLNNAGKLNMESFKKSILNHFNKSVDMIGIDIRAMTSSQQTEVIQFIKNSKLDESKLIIIK